MATSTSSLEYTPDCLIINLAGNMWDNFNVTLGSLKSDKNRIIFNYYSTYTDEDLNKEENLFYLSTLKHRLGNILSCIENNLYISSISIGKTAQFPWLIKSVQNLYHTYPYIHIVLE